MRQQKSDFIIEQMIHLMDIAQRQKWLRYGSAQQVILILSQIIRPPLARVCMFQD